MAVIVDIPMPKNCKGCQLATVGEYNTWCPLHNCYIKKGYSFKDCPLVEVKPHGRLIDADAFKDSSSNKSIKVALVIADGTVIGSEAVPMKEFFDWVDAAPTILEANNG